MEIIKYNKENTPNASKLMESLRYSGYDNNIAISDLIDNSLDANADDIQITINLDSKKDEFIIISDNGIGMDEEILSQALRLGSETQRDIESDLGRFGMGMVTASISIAKRIEVYTKKNGQMLTSIMDLDEMSMNNNFNVYREKSTKSEIEFAEKYGLKNTGTVLVLRKCDKLTQPGIVEFINSLKKDLGETYRYFLRSGKKMSVNGILVEIIDPMWNDGILVADYKKSSELFSDETYEVKMEDKKEVFNVKIYILPEFDQGIMKKEKIGIKTQGFYILRNYRQISKANDINGLWSKHNSLNRIRAEVIFSGSLDTAMGVNYTKHDIKPNQSIVDKFQNEIISQIETLKKRFDKNTKRESAKDLNFSDAERIISQKSKLLDKAEPDKKGGKPMPMTPVVKKPKTEVEIDLNKKRGRPSLANLARFENHSFGVTGPIFEAEKQGKITIIQWNIDHPFYQRFLIEYKDNTDLVNAVSFLAYSLGESKLKYTNEESYEMLENIMSTISTNLRVLLS